MTRHVEIRAGSYHDSVTLMQVSRAVRDAPRVHAALVAMATELNLELLAEMGFQPPSDNAGPNNLVVALHAADDDALGQALALVDTTLAASGTPGGADTGFGDRPAARTVGAAARRSDATVAFVSTPGRYAFTEAIDALHSDLPVIVFSDNVPLEQEIQLKTEAQRRGLLVMGPDCGTAVVGGAGFGFANVVRPGPVGLVAASGTGAQHLMCLLDAAGVGISHCLGVGGRDLSAAVGGVSTMTALDLLAADDATEAIVVVSKPPAPEVAEHVRAHAASLGTPVLFALLGEGQPDLTSAARSVVEAAGGTWAEPRSWTAPARPAPPGPAVSGPDADTGTRHVRGLFSGGTLCHEAMAIVASAGRPVWSNIPLRPEWAVDALAPPGTIRGDVMLDFGDDVLTQGRAHPMIDGSLRIDRMLAEAADPGCGALLLDVVLGHGAHPDPAAELAPAITTARDHAGTDGRDLAVVVALIGTEDDPQGLERQAAVLAAAGASVHRSNAAAARDAVVLTGGAR